MDSRLSEFLRNYAVPKGDKNITHTSMITSKVDVGRYCIPDEDLDDFFDLYNEVIATDGIASINEIPKPITPMFVDIDLKIANNNLTNANPQHPYKSSHIKKLIGIYQEILQDIILDPKPENLYCVVLEKKQPRLEGNTLKSGFHLHFPHFYSEHWVQKEWIRTKVIEKVQEVGLFEDMILAETLEKVFDRSVPSKPWLLLGSRKNKDAEPYLITKKYDGEMEKISLSVLFENEKGKSKSRELPRLLSLRYYDYEPTPLKGHVKKGIKRRVIKEYEYDKSEAKILEELIKAESIMGFISDARADDYRDWWDIGCILYGISRGHPKGLELWIDFSKKSDKFREGECEKIWEKMKPNNYKIATLKFLAKKDSHKEFSNWIDTNLTNSLTPHDIKHSHTAIAQLIHVLYQDRWICADPDTHLWYYFDEHRWKIDKGTVYLRKTISTDLVARYSKMLNHLSSQKKENMNPVESQMHTYMINTIAKIMKSLETYSYKNQLIKECEEYFYDPHFLKLMDENPYILVFKNGVYDTTPISIDGNNKVQGVFRDGRPDDYTTKCTGINFRHFNWDDPEIVECEEILAKIFVDKEIYKFFRQITGDLVEGGNFRKILTVWSNSSGDNAKSLVADWIGYAFGSGEEGYYYTPPNEVLTGKSRGDANAHTAALCPLKGARIAIVSETGSEDTFNCGFVKKLTGGDTIPSRPPHSKTQVMIKPQFKFILHCNHKPEVDPNDKAMWNRLCEIPFQSRFVEDFPKTEKEQWAQKLFPKDESLKDRIKELAEPFMWLIIQWYKAYRHTPLKKPKAILEATKEYKKKNDYYMQFIEEKIVKVDDDKTQILTVSEVYKYFKEWFREANPSKASKIPNRDTMKDALVKELGQPIKNRWFGVKIAGDENED